MDNDKRTHPCEITDEQLAREGAELAAEAGDDVELLAEKLIEKNDTTGNAFLGALGSLLS